MTWNAWLHTRHEFWWFYVIITIIIAFTVSCVVSATSIFSIAVQLLIVALYKITVINSFFSTSNIIFAIMIAVTLQWCTIIIRKLFRLICQRLLQISLHSTVNLNHCIFISFIGTSIYTISTLHSSLSSMPGNNNKRGSDTQFL